MSVAQRKDDHIAQCLKDSAVDRTCSGFDQIRLPHRALPEIDFDKVGVKKLMATYARLTRE